MIVINKLKTETNVRQTPYCVIETNGIIQEQQAAS